MAGFEPRRNNRGNYACPYCTHKAWKGKQGAINHIKNTHKAEAELSQAKADAAEEVRKANNAKWEAERRADRAEREAAALRAKPKQPRYAAVVYCPVCQSVDSVNIVHGQQIGAGGCFRCGNLGGQLVQHVNVNAGDYKIEGGKE